MKKLFNFLGIIVISTIICLTYTSCIAFVDPPFIKYVEPHPNLKVVNKHDLPITGVGISFIEKVSPSFNEYFIIDLNIPKGESETFPLEPYNKPYNAEIIVYFGDMHSYKEFRFTTDVTTTATLNENGILE